MLWTYTAENGTAPYTYDTATHFMTVGWSLPDQVSKERVKIHHTQGGRFAEEGRRAEHPFSPLGQQQQLSCRSTCVAETDATLPYKYLKTYVTTYEGFKSHKGCQRTVVELYASNSSSLAAHTRGIRYMTIRHDKTIDEDQVLQKPSTKRTCWFVKKWQTWRNNERQQRERHERRERERHEADKDPEKQGDAACKDDKVASDSDSLSESI